MSGTVTIRRAMAEDAPAIARVCEAAFKPIRQIYSPREPHAAPPPPPLSQQITLVAFVEGEVVGTLRYAMPDSRRVHLIGLAVHPLHQRRGVARTLIEFVAQVARRHRRAVLSLYTIRETGNCAVFERLGFHVIREELDDCEVSDHFAVLTDAYMERDAA